MTENYKIENFDQFEKMLGELNDNVRRDVLRKGFAEGSKPLIQQARANTTSKRIQQSIGTKIYGNSEYGEKMLVGARTSKKYQGFLAKFQEDGTKEREYKVKRSLFSKKQTHRTGKITGDKFWTRSVQQSEPRVFENISKVFIDAMNKILAKYTK